MEEIIDIEVIVSEIRYENMLEGLRIYRHEVEKDVKLSRIHDEYIDIDVNLYHFKYADVFSYNNLLLINVVTIQFDDFTPNSSITVLAHTDSNNDSTVVPDTTINTVVPDTKGTTTNTSPIGPSIVTNNTITNTTGITNGGGKGVGTVGTVTGAVGIVGRGPHTVTEELGVYEMNYYFFLVYNKMYQYKPNNNEWIHPVELLLQLTKLYYNSLENQNNNKNNYKGNNIWNKIKRFFNKINIFKYKKMENSTPGTVLGHTATVVPGTTNTNNTTKNPTGPTTVTPGKGANDTFSTPGKGANFTAMECTMGKGANFMGTECTIGNMGKGANFMGMECTIGNMGTVTKANGTAVGGPDTVSEEIKLVKLFMNNKFKYGLIGSLIPIIMNIMNIIMLFLIIPLINLTRKLSIELYMKLQFVMSLIGIIPIIIIIIICYIKYFENISPQYQFENIYKYIFISFFLFYIIGILSYFLIKYIQIQLLYHNSYIILMLIIMFCCYNINNSITIISVMFIKSIKFDEITNTRLENNIKTNIQILSFMLIFYNLIRFSYVWIYFNNNLFYKIFFWII
uniref:Integral membrane protein, putative n=1 Tax=Theileria annulata TaxID=5874 RepID=A0A3B0MQQ2_THEAN